MPSPREELAQILKTVPEKLDVRLVGMRLAPACGRCGGSGSYSFNQIDGSRCYGCNGKGHVAPKDRDLPACLDRAREAVTAGDLDRYLQGLADARFIKDGDKTIFALWTGTVAVKLNPHHCLRDDELAPLQLAARRANAKMAAAHDRWSKVKFDRTLDATGKASVLREALDEIKAVDIEQPDDTPSPM